MQLQNIVVTASILRIASEMLSKRSLNLSRVKGISVLNRFKGRITELSESSWEFCIALRYSTANAELVEQTHGHVFNISCTRAIYNKRPALEL